MKCTKVYLSQGQSSAVLFTPFGCLDAGEAAPKGLGHNLLMQFSTLCSSKIKTSETDFFDILAFDNDQISNIKHAVDPLYVFSTRLGCLDDTLLMQFSTLCNSKMEIFF